MDCLTTGIYAGAGEVSDGGSMLGRFHRPDSICPGDGVYQGAQRVTLRRIIKGEEAANKAR